MSVVDIAKTGETSVEGASKGGKKKLVILVAVVLVALGAGYWYFLMPSGAPKPPEPGAVVKLDPIQINLAADHYLKVGIALQASRPPARTSTAARPSTTRSTCSAARACRASRAAASARG